MRAADSSDTRPTRVSPPVNETDIRDLLPFYERGRKEGSFDLGIQKALERLVSSQFLFRIEREPSSVATGAAYRISDIELASRCRSSSGAAFQTMSCSTLRRPDG